MDIKELQKLCEANGLAVDDVRAAGDVLVVTPASIDELPDAATFDRLAHQLREASSVRYITLAVDEAAEVQS